MKYLKTLLLMFFFVGILNAQSRNDAVDFYGAYGTLTSEVDTLSASVSSGVTTLSALTSPYAKLRVVLIVDDTVEVSTSASFTSGNVQKILPTEYVFGGGGGIAFELIFRPNIINNIYIRRFVTSGGTGTVNWIARIYQY